MHQPLLTGVVASAAAVVLTAVALATAAPGTSNGEIVFVRLSDTKPTGTLSLVITDPQGRAERTILKTTQRMLAHPDWSPDARRIAFTSCRFAQDRCRIGVVGADGGGLRYLHPECRSSTSCVQRLDPAWSPSGKLLAYTRTSGRLNTTSGWNAFRDVYVMRPDGSGERRVTRIARGVPFGAEVLSPTWSPDGKRLAFGVTLADSGAPGGERRAVYVADLDGSDLRRITPWTLNGMDPKWSLDGRRILFRGAPVGEPWEVVGNLYSMRPDGSDVRKLTHYPQPIPELDPIGLGGYSPDGSSIVYATQRGGTRGTFAGTAMLTGDVFLVDADGSNRRALTHTGDLDFWPDWAAAR